jgi:hypothetical protein
MTSKEEDSDEDDPVVSTMPMYVNHNMGRNLFYVKDMVVPGYRKPYTLRKARIRPKHSILETTKDNGKRGTAYYHSMKYQTTEISKDLANLVMGYSDGKKFVISPVAHIVHSSPKLDSDDDEDETSSSTTTKARPQVKQEIKVKQEPAVPVPVMMNVKAQRHPRAIFANRTKRKTFLDLRREIKKDHWVDLEVHEAASPSGFDAQCRLKGDGDTMYGDKKKNNYMLTPQEYRLRIACKPQIKKNNQDGTDDVDEDRVEKSLLPAHDTTNKMFFRKYTMKRENMDSNMNANDRIRLVLMTARVMSLSEISELVRKGNGKMSSRLELSEKDLLKLLKAHDHAVCVRGVWVLASKFAITVDEDLEHEAISHRTTNSAIKSYEMLCRDYVLSQFQESATLRIRRVDMKPKKTFKFLRSHRLELILRELSQAVNVPSSKYKEWMFRCDENPSQSKKNSKQRKDQDSFWNTRKSEIIKEFSRIAKEKFPRVSRSNVKREKLAVASTGGNENKKCKVEFEPIDKETITKMIEDQEKRQKIKPSVLHNTLIQIFQKRGVATEAYLKGILQEKGIPHPNFQEVLAEIAIEIPNKKRYALRKTKDSKSKEYDELRYLFIHLFSQSDMIRRKDVYDACKKCFGNTKHFTPTRYNKLTQEFATSSGSRWKLKTGNEDELAPVVDLTGD